MAHMNPKRTGVLLDFGTGTSFASFAELWDYLRHNGWATMPGKVRALAGRCFGLLCVLSSLVVPCRVRGPCLGRFLLCRVWFASCWWFSRCGFRLSLSLVSFVVVLVVVVLSWCVLLLHVVFLLVVVV